MKKCKNEQCNNLTKNPLFCSRSCAATFNNKNSPKRKNYDYDNLLCENCGEKIIFDSVRYYKKFCNLNCQNEFREKTHIYTSVAYKRKKLIKENNGKCSGCGLNKWQGYNIPLEIHHIDGNHKNNEYNNLQILCPNCHALTDTYKFKNKGNGRKTQREYYHNVLKNK